MKYFFLVICLFSVRAIPQTACEQAGLFLESINTNTPTPLQSMQVSRLMHNCNWELRDKKFKQMNCGKVKSDFEKLKSDYEKGQIIYKKNQKILSRKNEPYRKAVNAFWKAARIWVYEADKKNPIDREIWSKANEAFDKAWKIYKNYDIDWEKFKASPTYLFFKKAKEAMNLMINVCEPRKLVF